MRFSDLYRRSISIIEEAETKDEVVKKVVGKNPTTGEPTSFDVRKSDSVVTKNVVMYILNGETTHYIEAPHDEKPQ